MYGPTFTTSDVNGAMIRIADATRALVDTIKRNKAFLDATPNPDLLNMGFDANDIAQIRSAQGEVDAITSGWDTVTFIKRFNTIGV